MYIFSLENHQSQFLFNMETIFIFLLAATIDCVSPFGFHHVGIVSPKQSESKLYNSLFETYKTDNIPIWKKFHFWKKKRDFWTDDAFDPSSRFLSPENQDNFPPKTENIFSELKPYESFQFVDTQSEPSEDFDPEEMELNDMLQDSDPSDFGSFGPNVVPSDDSGLSGGFGVLQSNVKNTEHSHQTEGFINSGVSLLDSKCITYTAIYSYGTFASALTHQVTIFKDEVKYCDLIHKRLTNNCNFLYNLARKW